MQLQELEYLWKRLDEKVDKAIAIESELLRRVVLEPAHRKVNRMAFWPAVDVVIGLAGMAFCATSVGGYWFDSRVLIPASLLFSGFLALMINSILQLSKISELDWSGPVAGIQYALTQLRAAKVREFMWIMLLSPLWSFCGLIVFAQWFSVRVSGDPLMILRKFEPRWIAGNLLFGVVFAVLGAALIYAMSRAWGNRAWWEALLDEISGKTLSAARKDVELWASLQSEKASKEED